MAEFDNLSPCYQGLLLETMLSQMHPFHILNIRSRHHPACPREYFQLRGLLRTLVKQTILPLRQDSQAGHFAATTCCVPPQPPFVAGARLLHPQLEGAPCRGENWSILKDLCIATSEVTWNYTSQSAVYQMFYFKFSPNWEERKLLSDMLTVMAHSQWKVAKSI